MVQKNLFTLLLIFISGVLSAQTGDRLIMQNPSPLVAHPTMGNSSGSPIKTIPLASLKGVNLSDGASLTYTPGVKVNSYASQVGTGWSLSAGGGISRIINGHPDEIRVASFDNDDQKPVGYLDFAPNSSLLNSGSTANINLADALDKNILEKNDYSPDVFIISAPGLQASFVFNKEGVATVIGENQKIKVEVIFETRNFYHRNSSKIGTDLTYGEDDFESGQWQDCRVIKGFIITNEAGTQYTFGMSDDATNRLRNIYFYNYGTLAYPTGPSGPVNLSGQTNNSSHSIIGNPNGNLVDGHANHQCWRLEGGKPYVLGPDGNGNYQDYSDTCINTYVNDQTLPLHDFNPFEVNWNDKPERRNGVYIYNSAWHLVRVENPILFGKEEMTYEYEQVGADNSTYQITSGMTPAGFSEKVIAMRTAATENYLGVRMADTTIHVRVPIPIGQPNHGSIVTQTVRPFYKFMDGFEMGALTVPTYWASEGDLPFKIPAGGYYDFTQGLTDYNDFLNRRGIEKLDDKFMLHDVITLAYNKRLKKIISKSGSLEFVYGLSREDLPNTAALTQIILKDYAGNVLETQKLNYHYTPVADNDYNGIYSLSKSYMDPTGKNYLRQIGIEKDISNALSMALSCSKPNMTSDALRLFLSSVQREVSGASPDKQMPPTTFLYEPGSLPAPFSPRQDHSGYANGNDTIQWRIPGFKFLGESYGYLQYNNGNRAPRFSRSIVGSLYKIINPLGGTEEYAYTQKSSGGKTREEYGGILLSKVTTCTRNDLAAIADPGMSQKDCYTVEYSYEQPYRNTYREPFYGYGSVMHAVRSDLHWFNADDQDNRLWFVNIGSEPIYTTALENTVEYGMIKSRQQGNGWVETYKYTYADFPDNQPSVPDIKKVVMPVIGGFTPTLDDHPLQYYYFNNFNSESGLVFSDSMDCRMLALHSNENFRGLTKEVRIYKEDGTLIKQTSYKYDKLNANALNISVGSVKFQRYGHYKLALPQHLIGQIVVGTFGVLWNVIQYNLFPFFPVRFHFNAVYGTVTMEVGYGGNSISIGTDPATGDYIVSTRNIFDVTPEHIVDNNFNHAAGQLIGTAAQGLFPGNTLLQQLITEGGMTAFSYLYAQQIRPKLFQAPIYQERINNMNELLASNGSVFLVKVSKPFENYNMRVTETTDFIAGTATDLPTRSKNVYGYDNLGRNTSSSTTLADGTVSTSSKVFSALPGHVDNNIYIMPQSISSTVNGNPVSDVNIEYANFPVSSGGSMFLPKKVSTNNYQGGGHDEITFNSVNDYGQLIESTDLLGIKSKTEYGYNGTLPVTNTLRNLVGTEWSGSTEYLPGVGVTKTIDINGKITENSYDELHRYTGSTFEGHPLNSIQYNIAKPAPNFYEACSITSNISCGTICSNSNLHAVLNTPSNIAVPPGSTYTWKIITSSNVQIAGGVGTTADYTFTTPGIYMLSFTAYANGMLIGEIETRMITINPELITLGENELGLPGIDKTEVLLSLCPTKTYSITATIQDNPLGSSGANSCINTDNEFGGGGILVTFSLSGINQINIVEHVLSLFTPTNGCNMNFINNDNQSGLIKLHITEVGQTEVIHRQMVFHF